MRSAEFIMTGLSVLLPFAASPACNQNRGAPSSAAGSRQAETKPTDRQSVADSPAAQEGHAHTHPRRMPGDGWKETAPGAEDGGVPRTPERDEPKALTRQEQLRYNRVARRLVEAINAQDKPTYRSLHTDKGWAGAIDWWQDMFSRQILRFGRIERAYPPKRGLFRVGNMGMGGDARNGATFLVVFQDQVGGLLSFELNDQDKIIHTSVFIKEELAAHPDLGQEPLYQIDE